MTMLSPQQCIGSRAEAEGYVALVCFKHGPPRLHGIELEWTVHHAGDPHRSLDADALSAALGAHAPHTLVPDSPQLPLTHGSGITVEPGGQVEISTQPFDTVPALLDAAAADTAELSALLDAAGLTLGDRGLDPDRPPRRILQVPRYAAMQAAFDRLGPEGVRMMCSTASLQVSLDAGERDQVAARWRAVHQLGPVLVALFANSSVLAGQDTGWASARLRATLGTYPPYTGPPELDVDPAAEWARLAMTAPVLCIRRDGDQWAAPAGLTFGAWADGALGERPTYDDLDYHLSTLFPPVRPRGHLEVRYLDAQPGDGWVPPVVLLSALMATPELVDQVLALTGEAAGRWLPAARLGLADPPVLAAARAVVDLGCRAFDLIGLDDDRAVSVADDLDRRLAVHATRRHTA